MPILRAAELKQPNKTSSHRLNPFGRLVKPSKGFTLIELLIVIVIIGIASSVALLTISHNNKKNVENFANQLIAIITLAQHEAMLRPATLGLGFTETTYQFFIFEPPSTWKPLQEKNLAKKNIPDQLQLALKMQNQKRMLDGKPVIIISESSDMTPFILYLGEKNQSPLYKIVGEANGTLKSEPADEEM